MDALHLSRCTFRKIRQNLCWAFAYNAIALPLAAGAFLPGFGLALTPTISGEVPRLHTVGSPGLVTGCIRMWRVHAGALMGCSSLAVMANSILLRGAPPVWNVTGQEQQGAKKPSAEKLCLEQV